MKNLQNLYKRTIFFAHIYFEIIVLLSPLVLKHVMDSKQILEKEKSSQKKGGPYTEAQKQERQKIVYHLYFERGYSALRIAGKLGVNRNTINSDIKQILIEQADALPENEVASLMLGQFSALRAQKARLVDHLVIPLDQKNRLSYEKLICDIDWKIAQLVGRLMTARHSSKTLEIKKRLAEEKTVMTRLGN